MGKFNGSAMLLQVETTPGGGTFATIGGSTQHTLAINNEEVDVSDKDSSNWGETLAGAGNRSVVVTMNGWASDNANFAILEAIVESDASNLNYKLLYGDSKTITGAFHVSNFQYTGNRNEGQGFSCTFTSSGAPTFA